METSIANQNFSSDDPLWYLLAEFTLSEFLSDDARRDNLMTGLLFQAVQELGMSPQCMENIINMLTAPGGTKPGSQEFPGRIRIFCQRKNIDDANAAKTSKPFPTEHGKKQKQIFPDSGSIRIGGWAYFTIERGGNASTGSTLSSGNSIDLYLYREGE